MQSQGWQSQWGGGGGGELMPPRTSILGGGGLTPEMNIIAVLVSP